MKFDFNGEPRWSRYCQLSISIPVAAIGAVSSIGGAIIGGNAAKSAAKTQADAATLASQNQMKMFQENKELLAPFTAAGTESLDFAKNLMGLGPTGGAGVQEFLQKTPGYQFTLDQGLRSVQNSYAAKGLASSGAALKGAAEYSTGLANTTYEQRLQDYLGLAASGQNAASNVANLGSQAALAASNYATSGAAATAAGTVGAANALTSGISGAASSITSGLLLNSLNANGTFGKDQSNPLGIPHDSGSGVDFTGGTALDPVRR